MSLSSVSAGWRDIFLMAARRPKDRMAGSQPPAAAPPVDQHLRMAEAIVIGAKDAAAAEKKKKEKLANHVRKGRSSQLVAFMKASGIKCPRSVTR